MSKLIKKTVSMLLVLSLVYANLAGTVFGIVSYAKDENNVNAVKENEEQEEKVNSLEIKTEEFCKNNMKEKETEYQERLNLNLKYENKFNRIEIYDVKTEINNGLVKDEKVENEEEQEVKEPEEVNIFYQSTRINKTELLKAIGENGTLEIKYKQLEKVEEDNTTIDEEKSTETVLPEQNNNEKVSEKDNVKKEDEALEESNEDMEEELNGIINAENGIIEINAETEADEEDFITIIYPENTESIEIVINTETDTIDDLKIVNTRRVEKINDIEKVNLLETMKQIIVKQDEEEILNKAEVSSIPINYTKTMATLGMDKTKISTSIENNINFTITMLTDEIKYDLYKNPYFIIELPKEVTDVNINNTIIINNQSFEIERIETSTEENGNKIITLKLNGEQTEYTKSNEENIQIIIETTIKTIELTPNIERKINMYYTNENVKTYDGIAMKDYGTSDVDVELISNKEIIVETKAVVGDETITSFKDDYSSITVKPHTYNIATIYATVINNMGENIQNAKILGTATNIGPIGGVQNVYYTENENATADLTDIANGWTSEYTGNAKKYLIIIENFEQAQTLSFAYYMYMPDTVEEDTVYELKYDVYNSNNEIMETSELTINQESEKFDYYEDEMIKANIVMDKEKAELGEVVKATVYITNISGKNLENIELFIPLSQELSLAYRNVTLSDGLTNNIYVKEEKDNMKVHIKSIENNTTLTAEVNAVVEGYTSPSETIKANISYEGRENQISNKINIVKPSNIETKITSNKTGKTLQSGETIEYVVLLRNNGASNAMLDLNIAKMYGISIQKIEVTNLTNNNVISRTAVDISENLTDVPVNPGEILRISVIGKAKELSTNTTNTFCIEITGEQIYDVTTDKLINNVNRVEKLIKEDEVDDNSQINTNAQEEIIEKDNTIIGIAWIDKNENGKKDKSEVLLKGVEAVLIDTKTSKEVAKTTTNSQGEYEFNNIDKGNYVVAFNYNTKTFGVTDYKNAEIESDIDSDVIMTSQDNKTVAKTEVISLEDGKTEDVNIGLVLNKTFDMSINKGITKVTVDNELGTNTYDFNNTSMAKVEIDGKYLKGSIILVEYEIAVTNVGEVAGLARIITDKIPEGMKFNSELNTNWYEGENGILYCEALGNKELLPGETATIKLVLTKEMTDDLVTSPINTVTIEETFNEYLIEDKRQDNNSSEATIIISLTTGKKESYIWLVLLVVAIIATGTFGVIKITNKDFSKVTNKERRK